jgi:hypothetical protein
MSEHLEIMRPPGRFRSRLEDNIKTSIGKLVVRMWIGFK